MFHHKWCFRTQSTVTAAAIGPADPTAPPPAPARTPRISSGSCSCVISSFILSPSLVLSWFCCFSPPLMPVSPMPSVTVDLLLLAALDVGVTDVLGLSGSAAPCRPWHRCRRCPRSLWALAYRRQCRQCLQSRWMSQRLKPLLFQRSCYRFLHQPTITDLPRASSGWTRRLERMYSAEGGT